MAKPLQDIVFSTTYVAENVDVDIQDQVQKLGGKFRTTGDVSINFLIVGKRFTEKYNQAIKSGTTLISADTFFDVYHEWKAGHDIDFVAELHARPLKPMHDLTVCMTSLDPEQREGFRELLEAAGGIYTRDLTKRCDVLVCPHLRGRKAERAPEWNIPIVHPKWLFESLRVKAALDPQYFDLHIPEAEMGLKVAAVLPKPAPTPAPADERPAPLPKRRKSDLLFGVRRSSTPSAEHVTAVAPTPAPASAPAPQPPLLPPRAAASVSAPAGTRLPLFTGKTFALHGFDARQTRILRRTIESHMGRVSATPDYVVVSSTATHAPPPNARGARVVTEWAIERSLDRRVAVLDDQWGMPVYTKPTAGFTGLAVCVTGFGGIEQRHVVELVKLTGATFAETLTRSRDLLIAPCAAARKVPYAAQWGVPVASAEWLWQSALAGQALPLAAEHALDGKGPRPPPQPRAHEVPARATTSTSSFRSRSMHDGSTNSNGSGNGGGNNNDDDDESAPAPNGAAKDHVGYHDEDAEARARLLIALGERPTTPPPAEPATRPAMTQRLPRRAASSRR